MLGVNRAKKTETKCYATHGLLGHLDPKQPPSKRKPFASILAVPFTHKVDLILPEELYEIIKEELDAKLTTPRFSRVIMPLTALIEGDFFNEYIKKGDVLMLSEGTDQKDDYFSLKDGILTLVLNRERYERSGLGGKPLGSRAVGGIRPRWMVEINLRQPSMLHGKRGFDRIVYAFKNVLTEPVTWLFADLNSKDLTTAPIDQHFPESCVSTPSISRQVRGRIPLLRPPYERAPDEKDAFSDYTVGLYEWFSLVSLESPRLAIDDKIDPFLSRYAAPEAEDPHSPAKQLVKITWEGFIPAAWVYDTFVKVLVATSSKEWFSFAGCGFGDRPVDSCRDFLVLKLPGTSNEYVFWEVF